MKLLFGVLGSDHDRYRAECKKILLVPDIEGREFFVINKVFGKSYECPLVTVAGKSLLLNGVYILRDLTLDEMLSAPQTRLEELVKKDSAMIPGEFVNGAFNGVIVEGNSISIFNDFMALDPLYYALDRQTLIFSTSLALLNKLLKRSWNPEAIHEYLSLGYNFSYKTPLAGIECLPPASLLRFKNGKLALSNYAQFPMEPEMIAGQKAVIEHVHQEFKKAMRRIYSPKLKYSLSLTGGMDSRLIYFEWPDRENLMTETSGKDTSDFLKASALVRELGNPGLHSLEDLKEDRFVEGKRLYYEHCDNPSKLLLEYNYYHLLWKKERGADFHLSGAGGEHINGENLYLSRKPLAVMREAFLPYHYEKLVQDRKGELIENILYSQYRASISRILAVDRPMKTDNISRSIAGRLDKYFGNPLYANTYTERFRTLLLATASFYPLHVVCNDSDALLMPYNDLDFINMVSRYHPRTRELRRLELGLLKKYSLAGDIPFDTSHLRLRSPYFAHKFMRTMRMVMNIGLHKKIPFIQKGEPPRFRAFKYFDHSAKEYREYVKRTIVGCSFYDRKRLQEYFQEIDKVDQFNFYSHHREGANLLLLFRLAQTQAKLGSLKSPE